MYKILVIDDSIDLQVLMKTLFEGEGFSVVQATNGEQALANNHWLQILKWLCVLALSVS